MNKEFFMKTAIKNIYIMKYFWQSFVNRIKEYPFVFKKYEEFISMTDFSLPPANSFQPISAETSVMKKTMPPVATKVQKTALPIIKQIMEFLWTISGLNLLRKKIFNWQINNFMGAVSEQRQGGETYKTKIRNTQKSLIEEYPNSKIMEVTTKDGARINSMLIQPKNPIKPPKVVILTPGNDTSIFSSDYKYLLNAYLSRGISVMAFDYREVGLSEGTFSTKGSYRDIEAVYLHLKDSTTFSDQQILVEGYSYGSCPALSLVAHQPEIKLLLRCPMSSFHDVAEGRFKGPEASTLVSKIVRLITKFAMPTANEQWISKVPRQNLHILYAQDHLENNGVESTKKLLTAHLGHPPSDEEMEIRTLTGTNHFEQYEASPNPEHPLTLALDTFLNTIGFNRTPLK
jgi:hypothetical protein